MKTNTLTQSIVDCFTADNKVNTIQQLLDVCTCSEVTLRRRIKQIGMLVSYNFNSKFYTLSSMASFNDYGIWDYRGILFSAYGSLTKTVKELIDNSKFGYTPTELSSILHVRVNDLLRVQTDKQYFNRKKVGREYVYYNSDEQVFTGQYKERQLLIASSSLKNDATGVLKEKDIIIAILVEILLSGKKLHEEDIQQALKNKSVNASVAEINAVISHYGLKKTMHKL